MTPKQKAKELILKFAFKGAQHEGEAKKFALIAVDEILHILWHTHKNESEYRFWQEVKHEIEKITNSEQEPRDINKCQYCGLENDNHKLSCPVIKVTMII